MHSALERAVGLQVTVQSHVESTPPLGVGCALAWPSPWRRLASNTLERAIHMKSYQEQLYLFAKLRRPHLVRCIDNVVKKPVLYMCMYMPLCIHVQLL